MRYITILMTIIIYWFLLGIMLTNVYNDDFFTNIGEINSSYETISSSTDINMSVDEPTDTTTLRSFGNALKTMFGFRVPKFSGIPNSIATVLSFINWFLLIILGVSLYRILNPISGG